jgi:signal transduction histidine kinase
MLAFTWFLVAMFILMVLFTILLLIATVRNFHRTEEKERRAAELIIAYEEIKAQSDDIAAQNEEFQQINEELNVTNYELVEAKDKAEESDRLKSAFLANMSHEIRTPMNGILGFATLLEEPDLPVEEQHEAVSIIKKSGVRMLNIINDLIDISKIESGLMEVKISDSNINEQIEYIYTFFKPEVEGKGMQLSYNISLLSKDSFIKTDREKIFAILTNLVKNSIKYSEKGTIEFGYTKKDEYLEFYVKDTGIGIAKEMQKAVFERFIQADINDHKAIQGAGLGLSITKAFVEMLGGELWLKSELGKGSTFYFTIPYNNVPQEITSIKKDITLDGIDTLTKKLKILIAEDDYTSDLLLTRIVKKYCKEDFHVSTGVEAIEFCRNNRDIDMVLMDIQMPDMNGYEATKQIRQFNKDVLIIAQTAFGLAGDREKSIAAGCNDYILKPIIKDELIV